MRQGREDRSSQENEGYGSGMDDRHGAPLRHATSGPPAMVVAAVERALRAFCPSGGDEARE
jgi:hypothetical protein